MNDPNTKMSVKDFQKILHDSLNQNNQNWQQKLQELENSKPKIKLEVPNLENLDLVKMNIIFKIAIFFLIFSVLTALSFVYKEVAIFIILLLIIWTLLNTPIKFEPIKEVKEKIQKPKIIEVETVTLLENKTQSPITPPAPTPPLAGDYPPKKADLQAILSNTTDPALRNKITNFLNIEKNLAKELNKTGVNI